MKILDLFFLTLENLKNRKSRVIFTILGVSVAIGTILFLVSLGYGLQKTLLQKITTEEALLTLDIFSPATKIITLNEENLKKVSQLEFVEKVSEKTTYSGQASFLSLISETNLNLVKPDFFSLEGIFPQIGRIFDQKDSQKIVINSSLVKLFNLEVKEALGKKIKILSLFLKREGKTETLKIERDFEIIGVILEEGESQIYLKKEDLPELEIKEYQLAKVKIKDSQKMREARKILVEMGFSVSALSDTVEQANKIFRAIQIILGFFGVIALIVATIGLINTMTISLLERTNEIGIMQALGASPQDVKKIFLAESLVIGFLGGVGGIFLGIFGAEVFNWGLNILAKSLGGQAVELFYYPLWFLLFIIFLSLFVGLIGGLWPAQRAAKLNPLEALRYK